MKINKWTVALAAAGLVSLTSARAEEQPQLVPVLSAVSATTISGYIDTSAQWTLGTGGNNAPYAFNAGKHDGFNINTVDLRIAKAADDTQQWSAGYMVDLMFGPDSDAITGGGNLRQAYIDLRAPVGNGLDIKIGRFDSVLGYESTDSYKNANFTRSYGYTLEPTEHTGIIAHYAFAEWLSADFGIANTVNTYGINQKGSVESRKAILGLLTFTAPKNWGFLADDNLVFGIDNGGTLSSNSRTHIYVGTTLNTGLKGLTFGGSFDSTMHTDVNGFNTGYAEAWAGYIAYKPEQSKWGTALRAEYARGTALGVIGAINNNQPIAIVNGGFVDINGNPLLHKVFALTGTVSYDLWQNVLTRFEVRWDHALDGSNAFLGNGDTGKKKDEVSFIANLVYKF